MLPWSHSWAATGMLLICATRLSALPTTAAPYSPTCDAGRAVARGALGDGGAVAIVPALSVAVAAPPATNRPAGPTSGFAWVITMGAGWRVASMVRAA